MDAYWEMFSSHVAKADNEAQARKVIQELVKKKVDCVKTYINLPSQALKAAIDEAHRNNLPVTGHLGHVDARQAVLFGIDGIEHASGVAEGSLAPAAAEKAASLGDKHHSPVGENWPVQPWEYTSPERLQSLLRLLVDHHVAIDPTLFVYDRIAHLEAPEINEDPNLRYFQFSDELKRLWLAENYFQVFQTRPWRTRGYERALKQQRARMGFVREFVRAGDLILAGSDTPNPYVVPGFSLHKELQLLVEAGLTPMEALQAATLNAAKAMRKENSLGTVSAGRLADLVLLNGDPLTDIEQTKNLHQVVKNGIVYDPVTLLAEGNSSDQRLQ